jgi:G:T-mismatch repair DNA endonuclease (very short patch repair protein)
MSRQTRRPRRKNGGGPRKGFRFPPGNNFGHLLKGIPKSEEWKRKASLSKMGSKNPMKNPVYARKMALTKTGKPNPKMKEFWRLNKDVQIRKMMAGAAKKRPNRLEQKLIAIIEENHLPFRYVGNWQFILGGKCPDFLNFNGRKQLIELFGNYWHTFKARETIQQRIDHFKQYGFDTLVIWQDELKYEAYVAERIKSFGGE